MSIRLSLPPTFVLAVLLAGPMPSGAQQGATPPPIFDEAGTWVYASYNVVSWARVDSLIKLERFRPALDANAIRMGCYLSSELLIHHTGDEHNVVTTTTYAAFQDINPAEATPCYERAWEATVPDATLRAAIQSGNDWVYEGSHHRDIIYWAPYPAPR